MAFSAALIGIRLGCVRFALAPSRYWELFAMARRLSWELRRSAESKGATVDYERTSSSSVAADIVAGDFLGVLAANGQAQSVNDAVLEAIPGLEWDVFSANEIVLGSPLHIAIERFARKQRLHVRRTDFRVCPYPFASD